VHQLAMEKIDAWHRRQPGAFPVGWADRVVQADHACICIDHGV